MTQPRDHTIAFLSAFYGVDTVYDFRAMHDRDRSQPARLWRGRFVDVEQSMRETNESGHWGIHIVINEMDGLGLRKANVTACRAQLLDLDELDAGQQLGRVNASTLPPHIIVNTSPGKVQNWFKVIPHADKQLHEDNQRRLIGEYNGDDQFIDVAHTARLPGFYHHKGDPQLVTVSAGPAWHGALYDPWLFYGALSHVQIDGGSADRQPLGHAPWQAPSADWLAYALGRIDPNGLGRMAWLATTAACKQAGWFLGEQTVRSLWDQWCARFVSDKPVGLHEYNKQWRSIDATSAGWSALVKRAGIQGDLMAAGMPIPSVAPVAAMPVAAVAMPAQSTTPNPGGAMYMDATDQARYFANCFYVTEIDRMIGPNGRMMTQSQFNSLYGGGHFLIDQIGKDKTREAWTAATKGELFRVPKVDHQRFMPDKPFGYTEEDEFGEIGVNTYRPPKPIAVQGDVTPFMEHLERLLPMPGDREILLAWMAQVVQRPGSKIGWAPVIQSMEGAGKTVFERIMQCAVGRTYMHKPKAKQLNEGGGKFNGWMHRKLLIIINEVKCDEKRELVEVMKEWITDDPVEMEYKGQNQFIGDNPTNWLMFTNFKDAIPVDDNSRRYALMYSAIQHKSDLARLGMNKAYFDRLYDWAKRGGAAAMVHWLQHWTIPDHLDSHGTPMRAPETSSSAEARILSRGWLEQMIVDAVEREDQGFRGGWVSSCAVGKMIKAAGHKMPGPRVLATAMVALGYSKVGLAIRPYMQEDAPYKSTLYALEPNMPIGNYPLAQSYGPAEQPAVGGSVVPMWPNPIPHAAE
jgi:hypothetical protein